MVVINEHDEIMQDIKNHKLAFKYELNKDISDIFEDILITYENFLKEIDYEFRDRVYHGNIYKIKQKMLNILENMKIPEKYFKLRSKRDSLIIELQVERLF